MNSLLSGRRRWLFRGLAIGGCLLPAELLAYIWLRFFLPGGDPQALQIRQQQIASGAASSDAASETIHPYLGWVHNPQLAIPESIANRQVTTNSLGFRDNGPAVVQTSPDELIIGITGGSVAWRFSWEAEDRLREILSAVPELAARRLRIVRLALPGYKQPQQLFSLSYVLALGGEFDAVVNLDGFNDSVLAVLENARSNTAVAYPRSWHARSLTITDPRHSAAAWKLLSLRAARQSCAQAALHSQLRFSSLYQLIWITRDEFSRRKLLDLALAATQSRRDSFVHHGPPPPRQENPAAKEAIELWARTSRQMHDLCTARGIAYIHCLQPSQYLPGTKPFSPTEQTFCLSPEQPHATLAASLFPLLQEQGQLLARAGVTFVDLTAAFRNHHETLYVDPWCHVTAEGSKLLAETLAPALINQLKTCQ